MTDQQVPPLPRALDPNKFAAAREPEITALCSSLKAALGDKYGIDTLPRHLRRRTRSHNPYTHRRRPNVKLRAERGNLSDAQPADEVQGTARTEYTNRRMRRRPGRLQAEFAQAAKWTDVQLQSEPSQVRHLETHIWHAKRLRMIQRWGWQLPEGTAGKGRGSRDFARQLTSGCIMHDASYWCPLLLVGGPAAVHAVICQVMDPSIATWILEGCSGTSAGWECETMLHQLHLFPAGSIGPAQITFLLPEAVHAAAAGHVHLCIWVHAAAAREAHAVLTAAATSVSDVHLRVIDLRRLELRGGRADGALAGALQAHVGTATANANLPAALHILTANEAAHLVLPDPRLTKPVAVAAAASLLDGVAEPSALTLLQPNGRTHLPLSEAEVSRHRGALRRRMLHIEDIPGVDAEQEPIIGTCSHFPALFVRHGSPDRSSGWSVVVPAGWVRPLWLALAYVGCRPAGQREWRWLHTLKGLPFFPHDAIDTPAYAQLMSQLAVEQQQEADKQPKSKRAPPAPLPPAWHALATTHPGADSQPAVQSAAGEAGSRAELVVARSMASMGRVLWGVGGGPPAVGAPQSARPVVNALQAGTLQWRIRLPDDLSRHCLEALVRMVKRGSAEEGAEICTIAGREAEQCTQPLYLQGSTPTDLADTHGVDPADLQVIGFICSPAPHGTPRTAPSVGACSAAALWRLRSLQHWAPRRDNGRVQAWLRNPRSTVLFPVRISLLVEQP